MSVSKTPSNRISLRARLKAFFKVKDSTENSILILEKFILPFAEKFNGDGQHEDTVLEAFFNTSNRHIFEVEAIRPFNMIGGMLTAGNRQIRGLLPRQIKKGQKMLVTLDRIDETARITFKDKEEEYEYLLLKYEFETIKDWLNVSG